ncbi:ABC-type branched-chain amino acid transport system, substrate-binding protein [Parafrankia irregularis]|uniref:ABC-type branched-chain amino acid transport system, substrate-binding protein n=1 Tax=Parafrankia irregularis TaxID=795642 RepID=A0A0S4QHT3_9ACTN|nr:MULTISPECIES: ABC transporter substrate-binding protein [Parafrankia]MBE3200841.1 ABC transporter substrate-binding protein [Parafrankia sp. CH37]CUU54766.1 ABC-type branched-chain amino acid transport system, substrate-binding protein [Parafrankia irregularis]
MGVSRLVVMLAAATALVTGAAACGGDGDSGTPASGPTVTDAAIKAGPPNGWSDGGVTVDASELKCGLTASDPTRGITDTSIKVGGLAYLTSPSGSTMAGTEAGAKVRFQRENDAGGINGRTIDYIGTLDDGNDSARNVSQAKVLADQEKVFAVVPEMTAHASYLDTFCSEGVPFFGWGFNAGYCGNTIGFGITGCLTDLPKTTSSLYGIMVQSMLGGDAKGATVAVIGNDGDSSRTGLADVKLQIESVGARVVYAEAPVPYAGLADATPIVSKIMTSADGAPPQAVVYTTDFTSTTKLIQALTSAGFSGGQLSPLGYDPRLAAANFAGLQKSYTLLQWSPTEDASSDGVRQLIADFRKYAPQEAISLPAMAGYWAADLFVDAATKTGRDLTVDSFLKTLNSDYSYYVDGAVPQTRYPLNHVVNAPCGSLVQLNGTKYDITSKLSCGQVLKK